MIKLTHKTSSGSIINSFAYTHDSVGNRLTKTTPEKTISYQYDGIYRLIESLSSAPGYSSNTTSKGKGITNAIQQQKEYFTYDPVGNRLTSDHNRTYTYNRGNQLISENGVSYAYDKNGNLIGKTDASGLTTYFYDYENRLIKVTTPNGMVAEFKYDPFGRRIEKKITENGIATTKKYFYDNEDIILEYETKAEADDEGKTGITRYTHGLGIDEPLAVEQKGNLYYYHADGLGSIVALTDNRGRVVQSYTYDSFGGMKQSGDKVKQPYTYTAREWDEEIKLYFNRARYRDPYTGIFTSKDPISQSPTPNGLQKLRMCIQSNRNKLLDLFMNKPQRFNLYSYVGNNSVNLTDPSGFVDIPSALLKEILPEILGMSIDKLVGGKTGEACASRYCKRNAIPKEDTDADAECMSIFRAYDIPTGVPPFSMSEEYLYTCGEECYRITRTSKWRKRCCPK